MMKIPPLVFIHHSSFCIHHLFLPLLLLFLPGCSKPAVEQIEVLDIAVPYDPDTLDPHAKDLVGDFAVASNFYEPLVRLDAKMKILPGLASSWENPDPLTWIFHLRPAVKFHSGKSLSSADVVYSLERLLQNEKLEMRAYLSGVSETTPLDGLTVKIRTTRPLLLLLNKLNFVHIVPEGASSEMLAGKEDGTAPYSLKSWERGKIVRLQRFEDYWGQRAALPSINLYLDQSPQQAIDGLLGHKFQLIRIDSKQLEAGASRLQRYEMLRSDTLFVTYLSFDLSRHLTPHCSAVPNPFKSRLLRQALHLAIDRKRLVEELPVYASPATQPLPPFVFGFNPVIGPASYDLQEARRLMAESGYRDGFDVTLHSSRSQEPTAVLVKQQLEQIGLRVEVKAMPAAEYYQTLESGDSSFFISSFGCLTGDASDFLDDALHSKDTSHRYGGSNFGRYSNPEIDRLIEDSGLMQKPEERRLEVEKIQALVMQELPWIPLYVEQEMYAIDKRLSWQPRSDSFILAQEISIGR